MHQGDELHPQSANSIPSGVGSHPSQHIYLFIFCPESFLLNMKAIFEHWTVTLLGCLLVDKTWKSNLLSWAFLRIYSAERGGVERQATSSYLSQMPACFLRNEIEGGGGGVSNTHTDDPREWQRFPSSCIVPLPLILEECFQPSLCSLRREAGQTLEPLQDCLQSCEPQAHREQSPLPCSPPTHTYTYNMFANDSTVLQALPLRQAPVFLRRIVGIAWLSIYALR